MRTLADAAQAVEGKVIKHFATHVDSRSRVHEQTADGALDPRRELKRCEHCRHPLPNDARESSIYVEQHSAVRALAQNERLLHDGEA